jgi:hypothetical protein
MAFQALVHDEDKERFEAKLKKIARANSKPKRGEEKRRLPKN